jgi:hypothetical protein
MYTCIFYLYRPGSWKDILNAEVRGGGMREQRNLGDNHLLVSWDLDTVGWATLTGSIAHVRGWRRGCRSVAAQNPGKEWYTGDSQSMTQNVIYKARVLSTQSISELALLFVLPQLDCHTANTHVYFEIKVQDKKNSKRNTPLSRTWQPGLESGLPNLRCGVLYATFCQPPAQ